MRVLTHRRSGAAVFSVSSRLRLGELGWDLLTDQPPPSPPAVAVGTWALVWPSSQGGSSSTRPIGLDAPGGWGRPSHTSVGTGLGRSSGP